MKELKDLTEQERCIIGSQCRKFFLAYNKTKTCEPLFYKLRNELGLSESYDKEIWMFITCAGRTLKQSLSGSEFSLSAPVYKKANEIHQLKLDHRRASKVITLLDELGYIVYYKGYGSAYKSSQNRFDWMRSVILFTDKAKELFTPKVLKAFKSDIEPAQLVEVKCSKTKECISTYTKIKGIVPRRNFMLDYNGCLMKHNIELFGNRCYVEYKQIFHDNFEGGGRLYTFGTFQVIRSEMRQFIKIDNEDTTEVDLSNLHVSILRCLQGLPPVDKDFDQYGIEDYPRDLCKFAIMCMINCKTKRGSSVALYNICKEHEKDYTKEDCVSVIDKLLEHNKDVVFFGKKSSDWKTLQRLDSMICEYVVGQFIKRDEAVLSYHDSWIVKKSIRNDLINIIKSAWKHVMKVDYDCKVKITF